MDVLHHLGQGAAQAVQLRDHHDVAGLEAREQGAQLGLSVTVVRVGLFFHDLLASRFGQRTALCGDNGVGAGRVSKVADQHGAVPPGEAGFNLGLL